MIVWESPSHFLREVEAQESLIAVKTMVKDFVETYVSDIQESLDHLNFDLEDINRLRTFSEMAHILDIDSIELESLMFESGMIDMVRQPTSKAINLGWIVFKNKTPCLTPTGRLILGTFFKKKEIEELVEYV